MTTNLEKVKFELGTYSVDDSTIEYYIDKFTDIACNITHFTILPTELEYYVISSVVEALNRREHEGEKSSSALGVSTTFSFKDIEEGLKFKLRGKKNPRALLGSGTIVEDTDV